MRRPSFTQYDGACVQVLLGNEIFWSAKTLNASSRNWVCIKSQTPQSPPVNVKGAASILS